MGISTRHYCALMKKNWIIWKRTLAASICELVCPMVLMAILALARLAVSSNEVAPTSNISKSILMIPFTDYLTNTSAFNQTYASLNSQFANFSNFSQIDFASQQPIAKFLPNVCARTKNQLETPIIAYAGTQAYTSKIIKDLQTMLTAQQSQVSQTESSSLIKSILSQFGISRLQVGKTNFQYRQFESHQAIMDYLRDSKYLQDSDHPGICFGFSIDESSSSDISVKMIFNDHSQESNKYNIPSQLKSVWDPFVTQEDTKSFEQYTQYGYSHLQNWIANQVLRVKSGVANATIAQTIIPFKTDKYISDQFSQVISNMLPFFMLLMYILPVYRLISNIVSEKETKARESMKMMGLKDFPYWLSWFTYYFLVVTIISIVCVIILSFNVFKYSNRGIIFLFFWIFGLSLFGLSMFIQAFFSKARMAAITGTLVYFGTSFIIYTVSDSNVGSGPKTLASLLTTVAVGLGSNIIGVFETSGAGLNLDNINTRYQNYTFTTSLVLMVISMNIFLWIGIYLDNVLPSAYGLRKKCYFFLTASYWFGTESSPRQVHQRKDTGDLENSDAELFFEAKYMQKENFQPVTAQDLIKQEADKKILKITDLKKTFDNGFKAVNGINLKMYNGQIFALLGHNGAGKTTTISMLTGLFSSTSGYVEAFGISLFQNIQKVREFLGVCPQHDVLFDLLTPEEHLDIFCDFKGVPKKDKKEEIKRMLIDVDVWSNKDSMAKTLSGGNKRKLSVAIALIGGSKLVLLDEPTAGMDLSARRKLWNMLKNYKNNRIIILTTHYMDEADILGDRIGIMTGGKLICLGDSLFLKNRFGVGYNLTMVKKYKEPNLQIGPYLQEQFGQDIKKLSEVSSEITFQIPTKYSSKFKDFFSYFDNELESLSIRSYGVSVTTLEEVFLRVGHGEIDKKPIEEDIHKEHKAKAIDEGVSYIPEKNDDFTIAHDGEKGFFKVFWIHIVALLLKRIYIYKKNYKGLIIEIFIPVLLVIIGFAFSKMQFFFDSDERLLQPSLYPTPQRILMNKYLIQNSTDSIKPEILKQYLPQIENFDVTFQDYTSLRLTTNNQSKGLTQFDNDVFDNRYNGGLEPYRFGSYFIYEANNKTKQFYISTFVNRTSQDVAAIYPQFMYQAILRAATGNPNFQFNVITAAFPTTQNLKNRAATTNGISVSFMISIAFSLIPAAIASFIMNEKEKNLKHMQLISGMSLPAYWITNMVFDIFRGLVPCVIIIGLMYAFSLNYDYVFILFLLFPVSVVPFTYVTTFLFSTENMAQTTTIFIHFVIAGIGSIVAYVLRLIESTYKIGDILMWVLKIIPSYCVTDGIMFQAFKESLFVLRPDIKVSDLDIQAIGGDILIMMMHFVFWSLMLIVIELGAFNWVSKVLNMLPKNRIPPRQNLDQDEDVIEEEKRVEGATKDSMKVRVNKFRKIYPSLFRKPTLAVERTSFGLDYGECFALLGVNGAGKSTTFKSLTCDSTPTSGEITIAGYDAQSDFSKARKLIGYCPQHDAIFDSMTVEEHLNYYARIKGIPANLRQQLIDQQIKDLNLTDHRKKLAGALSGGNKRKLSVAMAVIGNPPIILLDEPSAGMDPEARRFMWSVVARISQQRKQSAVILTTHSMEEAEALSTKMGIMVKGGVFKCFGSSQHIKNKYGTGYEVEVKVQKLEENELKQLGRLYGFSDNQEMVDFDQLPQLMKNHGIHKFIIDELRLKGLGNDLAKEKEENNGKVSWKNFIHWLFVEINGIAIIQGLMEKFDAVEILEHYNDYFKMRVPRGDKTIGFIFGFIETRKQEFRISEYSVSQTTLEQIFQTFANLKLDDEPQLKFFKGQDLKRQLSEADQVHQRKSQRVKQQHVDKLESINSGMKF